MMMFAQQRAFQQVQGLVSDVLLVWKREEPTTKAMQHVRISARSKKDMEAVLVLCKDGEGESRGGKAEIQ